MAFLIACECGEQLAVGEGAAGTTVHCPCGRAVAVPPLRELRQRPRVEDGRTPARAAEAAPATAASEPPARLPAEAGSVVGPRVLAVIAALLFAAVLCLTGLLAFAHGRGSARAPLVAGTLETGTFWKYPLTAGSNEGGGYEKGSRVEVHEQFVVVTTPDGLSHVHPHGYYSGLAIKRD
jgi:hypothetical protein